jgi:hypothetical protein
LKGQASHDAAAPPIQAWGNEHARARRRRRRFGPGCADLSPDGKHFVTISNKDGRYCVLIHPLPLNSGPIILYPPYDPQFEML